MLTRQQEEVSYGNSLVCFKSRIPLAALPPSNDYSRRPIAAML